MIQLDEQQETRAGRLHREALVVDTCGPGGPGIITGEMIARIIELKEAGAPPSAIQIELEEIGRRGLLADALPGYWEGWESSGVDLVCLTVGAFGEKPFSFGNAIRDLAAWQRVFDSVDGLRKVSTAAAARRAKERGRRGVILAFQNATHIEDDLGNLELFYDLGVRVIQVTYNHRNLLGDGCTERNPGGLSLFGLAAVQRMNELGIMVDTGHSSDPTTLDAIEASERPIAVTHSFAKAIHAHDRGKSDDVIRAVGTSGGYFGVCLVPFFLTSEPEASLDHFLRHFEHIVELAGPEQVGIGTDWGVEIPEPLIEMLNEEMRRFGFREEHRVDWAATLDGFRTWQEWPNITRVLVARGYSDKEITGFLGDNFLRIFDEATR